MYGPEGLLGFEQDQNKIRKKKKKRVIKKKEEIQKKKKLLIVGRLHVFLVSLGVLWWNDVLGIGTNYLL